MAKNINIGGRLHSIATGNVVAGANEILDDNLGKKQTQINAETYSLVESVNNALDALSPDQQEALDVAAKVNANEAKLGYYVCDTDADVAAKTIAATGYVLTNGGNIRIKMTNANTADVVTLNINNAGAKALFYNGERASSTNSWKAGVVLEVYYDGTNYQAIDVFQNIILQSYKLRFTITKTSRKQIDLSGQVVDAGDKTWVSDFILLRAGESIELNDATTSADNLIIAFYSSKDESTFIEGVPGRGSNTSIAYQYTASNDVYFRIGKEHYPRPNFSAYKTIPILIDEFALFSTPETKVAFDNYKYEINEDIGIYQKRTQSRACTINVQNINIIKITANGTSAARLSLLNSVASSITSGDVADLCEPITYYINPNETVILDVTDVNYIIFSGSTDVRPNTFPITFSYVCDGVKNYIDVLKQDMMIEQQPTNIPLTIDKYEESDFIDVEGCYKIGYKLFQNSSIPCKFYDANYVVIGVWGNMETEGVYEAEEYIPTGTKYITYCSKYITAGTYYLKVFKKQTANINELSKRIDDVAALAANAGYHYLADGYGILPSNEDNTEALQNLVNQVNYDGGGIIELPKGTFNIAGQVQWKSNVGLIGQGQNVTTIKNTNTVGGIQGTFYGDNVNNVIFRDFTIDATESRSGKGMFMRYIEDGVFENLRIIGTIPTGLGIDFINRVKIVNCNIYGCGRGRWTVIPSGVGCSGIGIGTGWAGHQENFIITNCICEGNYNNGIFVEDQSRWGQGVMSDGSGQIIANNICRNGRNCGFSIWGGKNVTFANNISYNNAGAGFEIGYYALDGKFTGNQAIGNKYGFKIGSISHDTNHIVFEANEVRNNNVSGVSIVTSSLVNNIVIKENELYDNTTAMDISGNSTGLVIRDNDERGSTTGITIAGEHTDAVIKGNAYFTQPVVSATYTGVTTFVEQFMV